MGYQRQVARLNEVRRTRDQRAVQRCLAELRQAMQQEHQNLMPVLLYAVNEYAARQEMTDVLRDVWGEYEEATILSNERQAVGKQ